MECAWLSGACEAHTRAGKHFGSPAAHDITLQLRNDCSGAWAAIAVDASERPLRVDSRLAATVPRRSDFGSTLPNASAVAAYTAAGFGLATDAWHDFIKDDPPLADGAPTGVDRLVIFGGGFPLKVDGQLVGGVGVSGGTAEQDVAIVEASLR